ncbi:hypothetical protein BIW11_03088 [Tropilaelaps mercedesae]|uniref:Uncharacterized protein n=1 Tax=Tropilaelaps mercedesae TaxID=418985 RepID=A0A1V9XSF3_9ACAR|nr:hypothetical protein BIW11_03088 [Tropilaelaps mercedesae]
MERAKQLIPTEAREQKLRCNENTGRHPFFLIYPSHRKAEDSKPSNPANFVEQQVSPHRTALHDPKLIVEPADEQMQGHPLEFNATKSSNRCRMLNR